MSAWTIKATNSVNNAKLEERVEAESAEAAKEQFLKSRAGMSIEVNSVDAVASKVVDTPTEKTCPKCAESVKAEAQICRFCGYAFVAQPVITRETNDSSKRMLLLESKKKSAGIAAVLNLLLAGAGYIYCGRPVLGVLAFLVTVLVTVFTAGFGWFFMALVLVIDGILSANRYNQKLIEEALS